jgi:metal-responsive CopG/Arc/MetJ family transcriptional regulator
MNSETKAKNVKYMNTWIKQNYTRIGASYPKAFAQEFKDACKALGVSQSEVFRTAMQNTINQAKK